MHDRVIGSYSNDAPAEALMTHAADPLVRDDDAAIAAPVMAWHAVPEKKRGLGVDDFALAQTGYDAGFVYDGVRGAYPAPEVGF